MRVLALEPYYGGSHRAFLDGWADHSEHEFTRLTLPANKWKWRMRHASWTLADATADLVADGAAWDCVFCSDMLNLPEYLGLAHASVRTLPSVAYFHENQITYPDGRREPRDVHFGLSNMTTALAGEPWFNSAYHRDEFLDGLADLLGAMPDYRSTDVVERIRQRGRVIAPGINPCPPRGERRPGPLRILWAARWEHDKGPEAFFAAVGQLGARGIDFRLTVAGEQFRQSPAVFDSARATFADRIDGWGFLPREQYDSALADADVMVSTADHEFFGLSMVEAAAAGALPVAPKRLAYPEVLGLGRVETAEQFFYDGTPAGLATHLAHLADRLATGQNLWAGDPTLGRNLVEHLFWPEHSRTLDAALEAAVQTQKVNRP